MTPYEPRGDRMTLDALELVGIVRAFAGVLDGDDLSAYLETRGRDRLARLCIALACMVPDDRTVSQLLAWCDPFLPQDMAFLARTHPKHRKKAA